MNKIWGYHNRVVYGGVPFGCAGASLWYVQSYPILKACRPTTWYSHIRSILLLYYGLTSTRSRTLYAFQPLPRGLASQHLFCSSFQISAQVQGDHSWKSRSVLENSSPVFQSILTEDDRGHIERIQKFS